MCPALDNIQYFLFFGTHLWSAGKRDAAGTIRIDRSNLRGIDKRTASPPTTQRARAVNPTLTLAFEAGHSRNPALPLFPPCLDRVTYTDCAIEPCASNSFTESISLSEWAYISSTPSIGILVSVLD